jgi:signal transduction histidine kinase
MLCLMNASLAQLALTTLIRSAPTCSDRRRANHPPRSPTDARRRRQKDDGIGVAPENCSSGVGRVSMTERATELGGRCTNEHSPSGGTRVKAWLPILIESSAGNA